MSIPLFARKFILDFVETSLGAVFALAFAFPQSVADLKAIGVAAGIGVVGALISAGRRAVPGLLLWLATTLNVPQDSPAPVPDPQTPVPGEDVPTT